MTENSSPPTARKKKKERESGSGVLQCSHEVQVDELAKALLREYMHKRGFLETLQAFDEEDARTPNTIQSRKLMMDMMLLKTKFPSSIMEGVCGARNAKRLLSQQLSDVDKRLIAAKEELEQLSTLHAETETRHAAVLKEARLAKKKAKQKKEAKDNTDTPRKADKEKKKDKDKKEKKKEKRKEGGGGGGDPFSMTDPTLLFSSDIGLGHKAGGNGQLGFGGRDWKPPPMTTPEDSSTQWPKRNFAAAEEFQDVREQVRIEERMERERVDHILNKASDPTVCESKPPQGVIF